MTQKEAERINGYLDGLLTEAQEEDLNAWVKASPSNAAAFAEAVRLHDRLQNVVRAGQQMPAKSNNLPAIPSQVGSHARSRLWRSATLVAVVTSAAAAVLVGLWWTISAPVSAATELDRLIESSSSSTDCSYVIRNLDAQAEKADDRRPPIDNAALHVRRPDKYVLVRRFADGRLFATGSDGERSWSVPPDRPVRVSGDPMRFRGPVPGNQHGIAFVDLRSDLVQLRDAYDVRFLPAQPNGWRGLLAERKSPEQRGPRRVELWYDANTRVIHKMVFDGMPQARGGPKSVAVELIEQRDLGAEFFQHTAHHEPGRRVIEEE